MKLNYLLASLLTASVLLTSCSSDDDSNSGSETSSLKVAVNPVGAATGINIIMGTDTVKGTPSNGIFEVKNLKAGNHSVVFNTSTDFIPQEPMVATITAGKTTDLGTVNFDAMAPIGRLQTKVDGTSVSFAGSEARTTATLLRVLGLSGSSTAPTMFVEFPINATAPVSYTLPGAVNVGASYSLGQDSYNAESGTLKVTQYDRTNKRVSGYFEFEVVNQAKAKKTIKGSFNNVPIR